MQAASEPVSVQPRSGRQQAPAPAGVTGSGRPKDSCACAAGEVKKVRVRKAAGVKIYYDGKPQGTNVEADKLTDSTKTGVPFKIGQRNTSEQIAATAIPLHPGAARYYREAGLI